MMDFISAPIIIGIIFLGVYKIFELYVCRSERLKVIEKLSDKLASGEVEGKLTLPGYQQSRFSFSALKGGCLMLGIGLGLLVGFFICISTLPTYFTNHSWEYNQISSIIYGACVLLFGGAGLVAAFLIEMKIGKEKENE